MWQFRNYCSCVDLTLHGEIMRSIVDLLQAEGVGARHAVDGLDAAARPSRVRAGAHVHVQVLDFAGDQP